MADDPQKPPAPAAPAPPAAHAPKASAPVGPPDPPPPAGTAQPAFIAALQAAVPGSVSQVSYWVGDWTIIVPVARLLEVARHLRDAPDAAFDIAQTPERVVSATVFRVILRAIREKQDLQIEYQSLTRPQPMWRWVSPHAIASDGFRWHFRAYCHERKDFLDFIFGRILQLGSTRPSEVDSAIDAGWHTMIELKIGPHPSLTEAQRRFIELDYGMIDGTASLRIRKALVQYMKKRLGLIANISGAEAPQSMQQICLISERPVETQ